jgi:hypothetical protein
LAVKTIGFDKLGRDLQKVIENIGDVEIITAELDALMKKFVHVDTGYLKSTIYHKGNVAGADAPYAGDEEERGGEHAFATRAIEAFNLKDFADGVWAPL